MQLYSYRAKCLRVIDGDTVELDVDLGFGIHVEHRFRLSGINTPEIFGVKKDSSGYHQGMLAKARVEELVLNKDLEIVTKRDSADKYGRYLAEILVGGVNVGQTLLSENLAAVY